jgi:hypothetical protein
MSIMDTWKLAILLNQFRGLGISRGDCPSKKSILAAHCSTAWRIRQEFLQFRRNVDGT